MKSICLLPEVTSLGGPRSFQQNLIAEGKRSHPEIEFHFDAGRADIGAYLIIGAPRRYYPTLMRAKRGGVPVIQRLNGINWVHRVSHPGLRYCLHSEIANHSIAFFRRHVCTGIVYQSPFCKERWDTQFGTVEKPQTVIYNGVDLERFAPGDAPDLSGEIGIMVTEGNLSKGLDFGLNAAASLALTLAERLPQHVTLRVAGRTDGDVRAEFEARFAANEKAAVEFLGVIERDEIARLERESAFFFSAEINAACPNSVLEALANGLPVLGFDTGSLKDLTRDAGIIVPYGADPWKLEPPQGGPLTDAALELIADNAKWRTAARKQAEARFDMRDILESYLEICLGSSGSEDSAAAG